MKFEYFKTAKGRAPYIEWFESLEDRVQYTIDNYLHRILFGGIMGRRSDSYDEYIATRMQDTKFARGSLLSLINEFDVSLEDALRETIPKMGIKEFSEKAGIPLQNVSDFVRGKRKLKLETYDKYLAVFKLKTKLTVE